MKPATRPNPRREGEPWLLVSAPGLPSVHARLRDLPRFLSDGDLVVVNDAATLPASLTGVHERTGQPIEVRLMRTLAEDLYLPRQWEVLTFGPGNWRSPTEARLPAPDWQEGDRIAWPGSMLRARITRRAHPRRRGSIEFLGPPKTWWQDLYRVGRPVQYSYLESDLALWDVQTLFAGPPVSVEAPSAAFTLRWEIVFELQKRGVEIVPLTHAAGISSTGDPLLDQELPLPERYDIPLATAEAVRRTRARGGRVIAIGTTVTRALESAALPEGVRAGPGVATLRLTPDRPRQVVQGILSGFHDEGASHLSLLASFLPAPELKQAYAAAEARGYLAHEFGDAMLVLAA